MLAFAAAVEAMPVIEGMSGGPGRLLCGITTFKMTTEGWVESQYGMRDLQRAPNGSISQNYIPFLSSVSRTDCHLVYRHIRLVEHMLKDFLGRIIPRFLIAQVSSDSHAGLVKAVLRSIIVAIIRLCGRHTGLFLARMDMLQRVTISKYPPRFC